MQVKFNDISKLQPLKNEEWIYANDFLEFFKFILCFSIFFYFWNMYIYMCI